MTQREQWTYTDGTGTPKTEDVSIEKEGAQAIGAGATVKVNPDQVHPSSEPQTNGYSNEKLHGQELNYNISRSDTALLELEKRGIMHWSAFTDYDVPAIVWGSNGKIYQGLQASGPSSTPKDPVSEPTYWKEFGIALQKQYMDFKYQEPAGTAGDPFPGGATTIWPITLISNSILGASFNDTTHKFILPKGYKYWVDISLTTEQPGATPDDARSFISKAATPDSWIIFDMAISDSDSALTRIKDWLDLTAEPSDVEFGLYVRAITGGLFGGSMNTFGIPNLYCRGQIILVS